MGKDFRKHLLSFLGKFCLVVIKHNTGIQGHGSALGVNVHVQVLFLEFFFQCFNDICFDADDVVNFCLLGCQLGGL